MIRAGDGEQPIPLAFALSLPYTQCAPRVVSYENLLSGSSRWLWTM